MSEFAVIAQNDESVWDDVKGELYHYPATYQAILTPGCRVIYYKGKMLDRKYASERLSPHPHYFGVGVIGDLMWLYSSGHTETRAIAHF